MGGPNGPPFSFADGAWGRSLQHTLFPANSDYTNLYCLEDKTRSSPTEPNRMVEHQTAARNRARYALLNDRRRALFELHKLAEAVRNHPRYAAVAAAVPGLTGLVDDTFAETSGELCGRACQAGLEVLRADVARLYRSLAKLAQVWVGLTDGADLEPLVAAHYSSL